MQIPELDRKQPSVAATFEDHIMERTLQLKALGAFLTEALAQVADIQTVNALLQERGRSDLALTERADMLEIVWPQGVVHESNNFILHFICYSDRRDTGKRDLRGDPITEAIPATLGEVLHFRTMPKFASFDEMADARDAGLYPGLGDLGGKPAFLRAINLYPDFISSLVLDMSAAENSDREQAFEEPLFVAYQIMSKLVDITDRYVVGDDGVNARYLCA